VFVDYIKHRGEIRCTPTEYVVCFKNLPRYRIGNRSPEWL